MNATRFAKKLHSSVVRHQLAWRVFAIVAGLFGMIVGGYGILTSL